MLTLFLVNLLPALDGQPILFRCPQPSKLLARPKQVRSVLRQEGEPSQLSQDQTRRTKHKFCGITNLWRFDDE